MNMLLAHELVILATCLLSSWCTPAVGGDRDCLQAAPVRELLSLARLECERIGATLDPARERACACS
jgi:hypothetical protein